MFVPFAPPSTISSSHPHPTSNFVILFCQRYDSQWSPQSGSFHCFFFQYSVYYKAWRWYVCNHFICLTLCNLMDCSLPGSSVHEIFLTRILACVVISSSRGSCWPRDQTSVSCIARGFFFFLPLSHLGSPKMVYFLVFCFTDQTICYVSKTKDSFKWCH